ncbi:AMP-binding protein [Goodfellowiella coeruleoviolacea]|uniref:Acyl-CoA synthetase (AMP-forming)/AMP-acid ligase II n=1 Tax=Goodfellowiella coeruleoviolacea TaxID=334858 RepID=A0AAE3G947_9PSEU|nr:AMP-binding protein [Goodfellowiella coeruleoviolacea]MCP2163976.1 Acyl-CoA synthetase (AMP-forming)/AMP-acid ligase II [Goodfellowiella coeruleoviolacea]
MGAPLSGAASASGLWEALTDRAATARSALHCWVGDRFDSAPWRQVVRDAQAMTAGLRRAGVRSGTRVAAVLTNTPHAVRGVLAVWLAGGALASLPAPARGLARDEYAGQLTGICAQLGPTLFLTDQRTLDVLPASLGEHVPVRSWESFVDSGRVDPSPPGDDELAFVQYSSGSTSAPKGCALTPRAIAAQLDLVMSVLEGRPGGEVTASWLPLSHDMGMFGCLLTPWAHDFELWLSTPERFTFSPRTWFGDLAEFGATVTAGTNTALHLSARAGRSARLGRGLRTRVCVLGAERVDWDTLRLAVDAFGPHGLRAEAFTPAYGLAEATLAVTATPAAQAPRHLVLDAVALADGELVEVAPDDPAATRVVSAGLPGRGVELVGMSADAPREIQVRSASLAEGYLGDERRTREHFRDGTLLTGDLGFVRDGHLYPVGRVDDVLSVAGRKVHAREIESAVDGLDGVRRGCSALVGHYDGGGLRLTLFVELRRGPADYRALAERAAGLVMARGAVALDECVFLERNSLPRTPSGKIQRHRCWPLFSTGRFTPLATVDLAAG